MRRWSLLFILGSIGCSSLGSERDPAVVISSVALRVHRLEEMVAFYQQAFGARFREVDTFGVKSRFADIHGITLKFVPIRQSTDFGGYPVHQLGFRVLDVEEAISLAKSHGGRQEGEVHVTDEGVHAAVRDPDGNTIELYGPRSNPERGS